MKSKFKYACFQGDPAFSDAINRFSTKKYHSLYLPTMLRPFFLLSPRGDKKAPLPPPSPKASPQPPPAMPATPTEPPSAQLEPPSPMFSDSTMKSAEADNFSDINGDLSSHCPLKQEFLPVPCNANATMFGDSAMKSAEAGCTNINCCQYPHNMRLETTVKSSHCHKLKVNIFLTLKFYILMNIKDFSARYRPILLIMMQFLKIWLSRRKLLI